MGDENVTATLSEVMSQLTLSAPKVRGAFDRLPVIGSTLVKLPLPDNELVGAMLGLAAIGYILVLLAAVAPPVRGNGWLSAVGITFLSVGTSTFCTLLVARRSAIEGYRRDANLRRKDEVYAPLHTQLKQLLDQSLAADQGASPYPQWVEVPGTQHPLGAAFLPGYRVPALDLWPAYRADHRRDAFTPAAQALLDATLDCASAYDEAILAVRDVAKDLLGQQLKRAISMVKEDPTYQRWYERQVHDYADRGQSFPAQLSSAPGASDPRRQLFAAIAFGLQFEMADHPLHKAWAAAFLEALPMHEPGTLGWILTGRPDEAAHTVHDTTLPFNCGATAPREWYEERFAAVAKGVQAHPAYQTWIAKVQKMEEALHPALARVTEGLAYIRDRYEGGAPPV